MVFIVLYMGTIVPNKEKTDAFNITRLYDHKNLWGASKCACHNHYTKLKAVSSKVENFNF